jgi:hypothetical protein
MQKVNSNMQMLSIIGSLTPSPTSSPWISGALHHRPILVLTLCAIIVTAGEAPLNTTSLWCLQINHNPRMAII